MCISLQLTVGTRVHTVQRTCSKHGEPQVRESYRESAAYGSRCFPAQKRRATAGAVYSVVHVLHLVACPVDVQLHTGGQSKHVFYNINYIQQVVPHKGYV